MGIIQSIQKSLYTRALLSKARNASPKRRFNGWEAVEMCSILFEENGFFPVEDVLQFAEKLRRNGKQVFLLAYQGKNIRQGLSYKTFGDKDVTFSLIPKSNIVDEFVQRHVHLFYNLIPIEKTVSEYITSTCNSDFKIGLFTGQDSELDLMINVKDPDLKEFNKTVNRVLQNTLS